MSNFPQIFPPFYLNMVKAGEASGTINLVLERLADFSENQQSLIFPLFLFARNKITHGGFPPQVIFHTDESTRGHPRGTTSPSPSRRSWVQTSCPGKESLSLFRALTRCRLWCTCRSVSRPEPEQRSQHKVPCLVAVRHSEPW